MNFEDTCKGFLEVGKVSFACSKAFSFLVVLQVLITVLQLVIKNSCLLQLLIKTPLRMIFCFLGL